MTKSFHLRSDYIIRRLLKELGLERVTPSTYAEYSYIDVETQKRSTLRVRISDPLVQKPSRADVFRNTSNVPYEKIK